MLCLSLFNERLDLNKLTPTEISLKMADKSTAIPVGICEDVPVVVANVTILTDFVILLRCPRMKTCRLSLVDPS